MAACANAMLELLALFEDAKAAGAVVCSSPDEDACTSEDEHVLSAEADHVTACSAHADVRLAGGKPPRSARAPRSVCILTVEQAATIFLARTERTGKRCQVASRLAQQFGVSPRTVRDIWNLRTWTAATRPLWSSADFARAAQKQQGRAPPEARNPDAAHDEWKLCAVWLTPGEELERDEFDSALDYILASSREREREGERGRGGESACAREPH